MSEYLKVLAKLAQRDSFPEELIRLQTNKALTSKAALASLSPFIDSERFLRIGVRINSSHYIYMIKNTQFYLSRITRSLIFQAEHKRLLHATATFVLSKRPLLAHWRSSII